jgi:colanic acid/amylovoran/stewartan biosynthesis glycosyltransferase WcaL/AmsK/CpsK
MGVGEDRPTVGHVNYSFFASTQSFIYRYLVAIRRFRSICLTRAPESAAIRDDVPPALEGDLYRYAPGNASRATLLSGGLSVRRVMSRVPPRLSEPILDVVNRRIAPRLRADADPEAYLDWAEGVLRQRDARIIHAYFGPVAWRALELRRRLGVPLVVTSLGDDMAPSVAPWWWWWIQKGSETPDWPARLTELFAEGDLFLAQGPHLRDRLIAYGCPPEKAQLQRMALPVGQLPFRARGRRPPRKPVILFAGRFCEQKGILYALEAVRALRGEGRDFEFRLVGDETMTDGTYAARVYSYIRMHDLEDRVRMLGWQNIDHCLREMQDADIFLHPSVVDDEGRGEGGAPTAILEAQALGMPVVSTTHCDIPYVTRPGESALLAPERDSGALADALRSLLDDPARWEEMGRAGRAHVEERHDITREAERLEERYLALLTGGPPGGPPGPGGPPAAPGP